MRLAGWPHGRSADQIPIHLGIHLGLAVSGRRESRILNAVMGQYFAEQLKRLRHERGLSLRQVAGISGMPHMTYVGYENGKAVPPTPRRAGVAEALGITPQALDDLIEEDSYEVFLRSSSLSEEARSAARDFLRRVREEDRKRRAANTRTQH